MGARRCTEYGKKVTQEAAAFLAKQDIPVISGMAKGIDGYAHTACLKEGGYTLAFLGNGVDICYPKEHQGLMEAIIEKGAVVSQYPPGTPARRANFPMRNYLISAWAHKILVVEASLYSGSLITAQWGMENNRTVLAVPSGIYHSEGKGTNRLIKNGAQIYIEPYQLALDLLDIVEFTEPNDKLRPKHMTFKTHLENSADEIGNSLIEEQILEFLGNMTLNEDQLAQPFQRNLSSFLEALSILELKGKIRRRPGGKISR